MIPLLMPLKDGHAVMSETLYSISKQTLSVALIPVSRPAEVDKREGEVKSRNALLELVDKEPSYSVLCMMDSDITLFKSDVLERAITVMLGDASVMTVHMQCKPVIDRSHFDLGCFVMRREVALNVVFWHAGERCLCFQLTDYCNRFGWKQQWLSDVQEAREISTNK